MEFVEVWNSLGYGDGLLFSGWLAVMYYAVLRMACSYVLY
jgi:hypothetical protein